MKAPPKLGPAPLEIPDGCRLVAHMPDGRTYPVRLREAVHDLDDDGSRRAIIGHVPTTALGDFPFRVRAPRPPKPKAEDDTPRPGLFDSLPTPPPPPPQIVVYATMHAMTEAMNFAAELFRRGYAAEARVEPATPKRRGKNAVG